jgi:hypothetical protein
MHKIGWDVKKITSRGIKNGKANEGKKNILVRLHGGVSMVGW